MPTQRKTNVLFLDGAWLSRSDAAFEALCLAMGIGYKSNVALMAQALDTHDQNGVRQVAYYHSGVDTSIGLLPIFGLLPIVGWLPNVLHFVAGATGYGLLDNLIAAYGFLVDNYVEGDDIYLFGFSRGAYTARALSALIAYAGILHKSQAEFIIPIIKAYTVRSRHDPAACRYSAEILFKHTGRWPSLEATEREKHLILRNIPSLGPEDKLKNIWTIPQEEIRVRPPPIKAIGVYDTVGALGVPNASSAPWFHERYQFFDTALSGNVQYAYHALAFNEDRADFRPTLWTVRPDERQPRQVVEQVWFKGSHLDVGGGIYPRLQFNLELLKRTQDRTRPWALQPLNPTRSPIMFRYERQVLAIPPPEERSERGPFEPASESIHPSLTVGDLVRPESSGHFKSLRERDPAKLRKMWKKARDPETLLPTEQDLLWTETQAKVWPPSIAYRWLDGWLSTEAITRVLTLVKLVVALLLWPLWMAIIALSFVTYFPVLVISLVFTHSLNTENLMWLPPQGAREQLARAWGG
ncbi:hypothetical protein CF319_g6995 [Tilletia indica]|nr:hypothetical protein CF319_g6995 [Tilletia indica]